MKWFLLVAAISGCSAIILDAFFAHGLQSYLGESFSESIAYSLRTASRYQLMAAVFLLVLILLYRHQPSLWVVVSQCLIIGGILLFSCSIYLRFLLNMPSMASIAPIGGISFMLSFLALIPLALFL